MEQLTWKPLSKFLDTRSRALETSGTMMVSIPINHSHFVESDLKSILLQQCVAKIALKNTNLTFVPSSSKCQFQIDITALRPIGHASIVSNLVTALPYAHPNFIFRECKQRHHTLLKRTLKGNQDKEESAAGLFSNLPDPTSELEQTVNQVTSGCCIASVPINKVLLSTALVSIKDSTGNTVKLRALRDSGS